jgi:hypothetical protein
MTSLLLLLILEAAHKATKDHDLYAIATDLGTPALRLGA